MKRLSVLFTFIMAFTLMASLGAWSTPALAATDELPERYIIHFKPGTPLSEMSLACNRMGAEMGSAIPQIGAMAVSMPRAKVMAAAASLSEYVDFIEPDYMATVVEVPNDTYFSSQWGMTKIQAPQAWDLTHGSSSVKIAILDTGIDPTHPDLASKIVVAQDFSGSGSPNDVYGHGTHCAGIAAAITNNGYGVAGVGRDCSLMNIKVLSDSGSGYQSDIANGLIWAVDHGANVISMSLGGSSGSSAMQQAVDYAWSHGVVVCAAAGNSGSTSPSYPAYYTNCIAVAATDQNDHLYSFSNYGSWVDVGAPGSAYSTLVGGGFGTMSGTSMATPFVSGLAGLAIAVAKDTDGDGMVNDEVRNAIQSGVDVVGIDITGSGRINAYKTVQLLGGTVPAPPPTTGNITGKVASSAGGAMISGATVSCAGKTAVTGADGSYSLTGITAGQYTISASASGYQNSSQTVTVTGGQTKTVNFALTPLAANHPPVLNPIGNKAVDEGKHLQFTVTASDSDNDTLTYSATGLPGGASFNTASHTFTWTPSYSQAGTYPGVTFNVSDGKATASEAITITVNNVVVEGTVSGTVTNTSGQPISGATVSDGTRQAATDAAGKYTLSSVPAGTYTLTATASGYQTGSQSVTVQVGQVTTANFALTKVVATNTLWAESITFIRSGTSLGVKVRVVNAAGPVSGASMILSLYENGRYMGYSNRTTDANGEITHWFRWYGAGQYQANIASLRYGTYKWDKTLGLTSLTQYLQ